MLNGAEVVAWPHSVLSIILLRLAAPSAAIESSVVTRCFNLECSTPLMILYLVTVTQLYGTERPERDGLREGAAARHPVGCLLLLDQLRHGPGVEPEAFVVVHEGGVLLHHRLRHDAVELREHCVVRALELKGPFADEVLVHVPFGLGPQGACPQDRRLGCVECGFPHGGEGPAERSEHYPPIHLRRPVRRELGDRGALGVLAGALLVLAVQARQRRSAQRPPRLVVGEERGPFLMGATAHALHGVDLPYSEPLPNFRRLGVER
eukprot:4198494-Prymnesium_polylepis.3